VTKRLRSVLRLVLAGMIAPRGLTVRRCCVGGAPGEIRLWSNVVPVAAAPV
jgi:hypothetical protein